MKRSEELNDAEPDRNYGKAEGITNWWLKQIAIGIAELAETTKEQTDAANKFYEFSRQINKLAEDAKNIEEQPKREYETLVEEIAFCNCGHPKEVHSNAGCMVIIEGNYCACRAKNLDGFKLAHSLELYFNRDLASELSLQYAEAKKNKENL